MKKNIPSLNGLRAISILPVIIMHMHLSNPWLGIGNVAPILVDGGLGVNVFFVLSGYLITTLLLIEEQETNTISLKKFYLRRVFRIFPAYYFMLFVYFILQLAGFLQFTAESWLTSLTFTKYLNWKSDWATGHAWSLSVEEQFYLLWPAIFIFLKPYRAAFAFLIVVIVPLFRLIFHGSSVTALGDLSIVTRADSLMWGCIFALYNQPIVLFIKRVVGAFWPLALLPFVFIFLLSTYGISYLLGMDFVQHLDKTYDLKLWTFYHFDTMFGKSTGTIADISIACIMVLSVIYTNNLWFRFLNTPVMNYVGKLSYSLYLWQQIFFINNDLPLYRILINLAGILLMANFSYYIIEKPFLKLKTRFEVVKQA